MIPEVNNTKVDLTGRLEFMADYYEAMTGGVITDVSTRYINGVEYPCMDLSLQKHGELTVLIVSADNPRKTGFVVIADGDDLSAEDFVGAVVDSTYMAMSPQHPGSDMQFPSVLIKTLSGKKTMLVFTDEEGKKPGMLLGLPIPRMA